MKSLARAGAAFAAAIMGIGLCACGSTATGTSAARTPAASPPDYAPVEILGLTTGNKLVRFSSSAPGSLLATPLTIAPLQTGETLVGLDFRPEDGVLVAVGKTGNTGRIYSINTVTGEATAFNGTFTLSGTHFGVDFNPSANRLRITSDSGRNLRLDLNQSPFTSTTDTDFSRGAGVPLGNMVAAAYTNNFRGSPVTTLYALSTERIDGSGNALADELVLIGGVDGAPSPNTGIVTTVAQLRTNIGNEAELEIDGVTGEVLALFTVGTEDQLHRIDLNSGTSAPLGNIGIAGDPQVRDITIAPPSRVAAYGISVNNELVRFNPRRPVTAPDAPVEAGVGSVTVIGLLSGLQTGEAIIGLDFRPVDGFLYGLGSRNRLYVINTLTAEAVPVSSGPFAPQLLGSAFGFDFNPVADLARAVSDFDQNLRLNPDSGARVDNPPDSRLRQGTNRGDGIAAVAYTSPFNGAGSTTLFGLDLCDFDPLNDTAPCTAKVSARLVRIGGLHGSPSPNQGEVSDAGALGGASAPLQTDSLNAGFDIVGGYGFKALSSTTVASLGDAAAFAVLTVGGSPNLYSVNLQTGLATRIGSVPVGGTAPTTLTALAVQVAR